MALLNKVEYKRFIDTSSQEGNLIVTSTYDDHLKIDQAQITLAGYIMFLDAEQCDWLCYELQKLKLTPR